MIDPGFLVAAYGAILSTVLAILHWKRDQGRFVIDAEVLHVEWWNGSAVWRMVSVVNVGRRPLYMDDFGVTLANGDNISLRDREADFPLKLDEGQRYRSMTIPDKFASADIQQIWAKDTKGKMYRSARFPFKNATPVTHAFDQRP